MDEKHGKSSPLNILFSDRALSYINKRAMRSPTILVNLVYRSGGGGCSGGPSTPVPYANVMMVDGGDPDEGFERTETKDGIRVYLATPIFEVAKRAGNPLVFNTQGVWTFKRLTLEGLDLSPLHREGDHHGEASCH